MEDGKYVWMESEELVGHLIVLIVEVVVGDFVAVPVHNDSSSELARWDAVAGGAKVENLLGVSPTR